MEKRLCCSLPYVPSCQDQNKYTQISRSILADNETILFNGGSNSSLGEPYSHGRAVVAGN